MGMRHLRERRRPEGMIRIMGGISLRLVLRRRGIRGDHWCKEGGDTRSAVICWGKGREGILYR